MWKTTKANTLEWRDVYFQGRMWSRNRGKRNSRVRGGPFTLIQCTEHRECYLYAGQYT